MSNFQNSLCKGMVLGMLIASPLWAVDSDVISTALTVQPTHCGMAVILGGTADQALALANGSEFTVLAQMSDAKEAAKLKQAALAKGWLGIRVYVDQSGTEKCLLADHLADLAISADGRTPEAEILRVIVPLRGRGLLGGKTLTKPLPPGSDQWTHRQHGPDNNQVSSDTAFRQPVMLQYLAMPQLGGWINNCQVASDGIIIGLTDKLTKTTGNQAGKVIARNLYNGTILWIRELPKNVEASSPSCALIGGRFYLADGDACRVLVIDPETGKDIAMITPSAGADDRIRWLGVEKGRLAMLLGTNVPSIYQASQEYWKRPKRSFVEGETFLYDAHLAQLKAGHTLVMWDLAENHEIWRHRDAASIDYESVGLRNGRVYFYSENQHLACLDAKGTMVWEYKDPAWLANLKRPDKASIAYKSMGARTIIGPAGQLSFSLNDTSTHNVFNVDDGKLLWQGYRCPELKSFFLGERYFGHVKTGGSFFFDSLTGKENEKASINGGGCGAITWVEGLQCSVAHLSFGGKNPCGSPVVVADGVLAHMPSHCACSYISMPGASGFVAAETATKQATPKPEHPLQTGLALNAELTAKPGDWPTYRGDVEHRGGVHAPVIAKARLLWERPGPQKLVVTNSTEYLFDWLDRPTPPITAGGLAFYGATDGSLCAIKIADGTVAWTYATGGAILTAPAIADSRLYAGSADGWVYCLEAASGKLLWRWRGAPTERSILEYQKLVSTWPVTGVLVRDGIVYGTAGHWLQHGVVTFALDAKTGNSRWTTWTEPDIANIDTFFTRKHYSFAPTGALTIQGDTLWVGSSALGFPALFNIANGDRVAWIEDYARQSLTKQNYSFGGGTPDYGSDLIAVNDHAILAGGYKAVENRNKNIVPITWGFKVFQLNAQGQMDANNLDGVISAFAEKRACGVAPAFEGDRILYNECRSHYTLQFGRLAEWQKIEGTRKEPGRSGNPQLPTPLDTGFLIWSTNNVPVQAMALGSDAAVAVVCEGAARDFWHNPGPWKLKAYDLPTGAERWSVPLPGEVVINGIAPSADGTWVVTMGDGSIVGVGAAQ